MKYWVYLNDQVLPQPYEAAELSSIPGFNEQTLICPEVTPAGEEQQWSAAGELINYSAPQPAAPEEANYSVPADSAEPQDVYDASAEYTPAPLPDSYGREEAAPVEQSSSREQILLDKLEYLINEVAGLKKDIAVIHEQQAAAMTMYSAAPAASEPAKKDGPIVKDAEALKAFQEAPLIPMNECDIPEEPIEEKDSSSGEKNGEPVVIKASADDNLPKDVPNNDDILESAIENTIRMKTVPENTAGQVAFDLAAKKTIEIASKEEEKKEEPKEEEKPAEEELPALKLAEEEPEEKVEAPKEESSESEILEVAAVGNKEEEEILKTFAEEKKEEEKKNEAADRELQEIENDLQKDINEIAEPVEEPASEPVFERVAQEVASNVQEPAYEMEEPALEPALPVEEPAPVAAPEEPAPAIEPEEPSAEQQSAEQPAPVQEEAPAQGEMSALDALTTPPSGQAAQEQQGTAQVESVDDKFLKTFTSSIEEVFLDQPTSIISDYVPPTISADNPLYDENDAPQMPAAQPQQEAQAGMADLTAHPADDVRQVKRIKPAAIKTVPMVAAGDPIGADYNTPNIEEAVTELRTQSSLVKGLKSFALMMVLLCAVLGFVAVLATMGILSKDVSPIHYIIDKVSGPGVEETPDLQAPAAGEEETEPEEDPAKLMADNIIRTVKNYTFADASTLEAKIRAAHRNNADLIQWSAEPAVDPAYYSIAVKLPPNNEGYSLTYRFNYNTSDGSLTPTTSESNNIMAYTVPSAQAAPAQAPAVQHGGGSPRPISARGR